MCKRVWSTLLLCLWMCVIFSFSAQPAPESSQVSDSVQEKIVRVMEKIAPRLAVKIKNQPEGTLTFLVRKSAHFFSYLLLGVLAIWCFSSYGIGKRRSAAFLLCILYAGSDELHQVFVPGRAGRFFDICVDATGSAVGIFSFYFAFLKNKRKSKKIS